MKKLLTEGALLVAIPALAHLISLLFELGYCSHFWIPSELIVVSLSSMFVSLGFLILLSYSFLQFIDMLRLAFPKNQYAVDLAVVKFAPMVLILLATTMTHSLKWWEWATWSAMILIIAYLEFVQPVRSGDKSKSLDDQLFDHQLKMKQALEPMVIDKFAWLEGGKPFVALVFVLCSLNLAYSLGKARASNQRDFMVIQGMPNTVMAKIYGENMVCVEYNPTTLHLTGILSIRKVTEDGKPSLIYKRIGKLLPPSSLD